ncbi:hypothetical protein ATO12_02275 [Aquimarina atlantica]|uniref:Uncharacterized protein n=1 Tax=Aquimarina atlantica TaxID=1317122 RepID=A0A023C009_9FLAO|nr:hypothetical protein [Aquimarina atlantica]EZH75636.1 hypothetical protein ATO12_02275 [Aquimarina atlantica]
MNTVHQLIQTIDSAIASIQSRHDYISVKFHTEENELTASEVVILYNELKQNALASQKISKSISDIELHEVSSITTTIIKSNKLIASEGQLNRNRTISPSSAIEENITLEALLAAIQNYNA